MTGPPLDTESSYGYPSADGLRDAGPTLWVCILYVVLFGISTTLHLGQALVWRKWFIFPTILMGGIGEIIGWSARLWSSKNPMLDTPFMMQISTTIISPTFVSAANFIILGQVVRESRGEVYSRLSPRNYSMIFLTVDIVALVIQALGGGIASGSNSNLGANIMRVGILIQLVAIVVYSVIGGEFIYRLHTRKPIASRAASELAPVDAESHSSLAVDLEKTANAPVPVRVQWMLAGLAFSTLLLFIRAIYRTIELSDGWTGHIIQTEVYFNVLDGGMVILCMFTLNVLHPGYLLRGQ